MPDRNVIKSEITTSSCFSAVWGFVNNINNLTDLCRSALGIRILFDNSPVNPYSSEAQRYVFTAKITPHDILLSAAGCSFAFRLVDNGGHCRIISAVAFDASSFITPTELQLKNFLETIKKRVDLLPAANPAPPAFMQASDVAAHPATESVTPAAVPDQFAEAQPYVDFSEDPAEKKIFRIDSSEVMEFRNLDIPAVPDMPERSNESESSKRDIPASFQRDLENEALFTRSDNGRRHKKGSRYSVVVAALAIVLLLSLVCGYLFVPEVREIFSSKSSAELGYSSKVNYKSALAISLYSTRADVSSLLGTDGVAAPGNYENRQVYRGGNITDSGLYSVQICVDYSGSSVKMVTFLDVGVAGHINSIFNVSAEATADMSIEDITSNVGVPVSMIRFYKLGNDDITELHFGFTDPFANFDPAWRGELVLKINKTQNEVARKIWAGYDGYDPLMIGTLEGYPAANQYNNYTDFLNDKFQYDYSLYMLNRYSRGDAEKVFGKLEFYDNSSGVELFCLNSPETLPGSPEPLYVMSFGFDSKGHFLMSSFSNMRLFKLADTLVDSNYRGITREMAYNEVRQIMRVIPTVVFVDLNYFTVCYGQRLDSDIREKQFEFIVMFDIENNHVQATWDNTIKTTDPNVQMPGL